MSVFIRAFKTFIQAAIGYICTISFMDMDWDNAKVVAGVILSATAAGISALMNLDWDAMFETPKEFVVTDEELAEFDKELGITEDGNETSTELSH